MIETDERLLFEQNLRLWAVSIRPEDCRNGTKLGTLRRTRKAHSRRLICSSCNGSRRSDENPELLLAKQLMPRSSERCASIACSRPFKCGSQGALYWRYQPKFRGKSAKTYVTDLKYTNLHVCCNDCLQNVRWTGHWRGRKMWFKMEDNDGDGDCLFHSTNKSGLVNITRHEVVHWLEKQHLQWISSKHQDGVLPLVMRCLAMEMATILHFYRSQLDLYQRDVAGHIKEAKWYSGVLAESNDDIETTFNEMDSIVRSFLHPSPTSFLVITI